MTQITIYSSNFCGACQLVKGYLSLRKVEYVEKNVSTDLEGRTELIAMGYDSTPVVVIGDRQLAGFDSDSIDEALAEAGFAQS
jgi:glutaredoxin|tara:strand:- start:416 stop:664 length:249 start_codon:yes stop_codon:yes gene_type:complete